MKNEKGFTLMEMAITLFLITALTMCAAPWIKTAVQTTRIRHATMLLEKSIISAKANAINEERSWAITFNATDGGRQYDYIVFPDSNENFILDPDEEKDLLIKSHLPRNVMLDTNIPAFCFGKNGAAKWTDSDLSVGLIHLENDIKEYTIAISQTGMIKTK